MVHGVLRESWHRLFLEANKGGTVLDADSSTYIALLEQLGSDASSCSSSKARLVESDLVSLMAHMLREAERRVARKMQPRTRRRASDEMTRVAHYLEGHFTQQVSLDELAQRFSISTFHLSREFKKATGYAPLAYVTHLRMELAKYLLEATDLSVKDIARTVGIHTMGNFIRLFRNETGLTPKEWRERMRA